MTVFDTEPNAKREMFGWMNWRNRGYTIALEPDEATFKKACELIETKYPYLKKEPILEDVDGSLIQVYYVGGHKLLVDNDYEIGCISVDSEIPLDIPRILEYNPGKLKQRHSERK